MAKTYKGSLNLEWYNKQYSILLKKETDTIHSDKDIPAPKINWVNKDEALFYEIVDDEGRGLEPYWVDLNDIRVKEARPLILKKVFKAVEKNKNGTLPGFKTEFKLIESKDEDESVQNILIKGDNLIALNSIKKIFESKPDTEKIKCIYIDPPYNTGYAFEHFDDNLQHSQWLTMMRDRMRLLHQVLSNSGCIFVQLDDAGVSNCKLLMDEIFGPSNFITKISVKRSAPTGHKAINPYPITVCDYILLYTKNRENWVYKTLYVERPFDEAYSKYIDPYSEDYRTWEFISLNEALKKFKITRDELLIKHPERIIRFAQPSYEGVGQETRDLIDKSKKQPEKIFLQKRDGYPDIYLLNGNRILFYKDKLKNIDGKIVTAEALTNFWEDIPFQGIAKEGGVVFQQSKKPEKLIKRILEMSTEVDDTVLDIFGGSGTTFSVAHKLNRRWIGVEVGKQADNLILPRLKSCIDGSDQSGISKSVNWLGGGSFKYYHLGPSIITINKEGAGDFNWELGKQFIQESFLLSYDYMLVNDFKLSDSKLFKDEENLPLIGIQKIGSKTRIAVISLNEPKGKLANITFDDIQLIYKTVKKQYSPEYINIFTNRGIEIAYDSKPDDLEIIKIPNAIFSELEK